VYLCYLDDSGSDSGSPTAIVGAVLIQDDIFFDVELISSWILERLMPEEKLATFQEFHAEDLFNGNGVFKDIPQDKRFNLIKTILNMVGSSKTTSLPFIYSAIDKKALSNTAYGGVNPVDLAFRMCALGVEEWIKKNDDDKRCNIFIMDDNTTANLKNELRKSFKSLRKRIRPPEWAENTRLWHIHDDMYFGDSKDSLGIQIADLCSYFLLRKLNGKPDDHDFYGLYSKQVVCAQVEPEWTSLKGIWKEHV
jgi:hypothetical protein